MSKYIFICMDNFLVDVLTENNKTITDKRTTTKEKNEPSR